MKIMMIAMSFAICFSSFAFDIKPKKKMVEGDAYVRVTNPTSETVSFEKCHYMYEDNTCESLGNKRVYTKDEIKNQLVQEVIESGITILVDLGLLYFSPYAGAGAGAYISGSMSVLPFVLGAMSPAAAYGIVSQFDFLNPVSQVRQARVISDKVISDTDIFVNSVEDHSRLLDIVLRKID